MENNFAMLTQEEIQKSSTILTNKPNIIVTMPVPDNVPLPDTTHYQYGKPVFTHLYNDKHGKLHFVVCRYEFTNKAGEQDKTFMPFIYGKDASGDISWHRKNLATLRPLYGLDRLEEKPQAVVIILEGEKKADIAQKLLLDFAIVTSSGGANAANKSDWIPLSGRKVIIWPDADVPGTKYAEDAKSLALKAGAVSADIITLPKDVKQGWDIADAIADGWTVEQVKAFIEGNLNPSPPETDAATVIRLAGLSPLEYDKIRDAEAKRLNVRASVLDKEVARTRKENKPEGGKVAMFPVVEIWPEPIDAAALLSEIEYTIKQFIICERETAIAAALWISFTWFIDKVQVAPLAIITAPEMRCGKSQMLNLIGKICNRPLVASNISASAIYRVIQAYYPTLLIDEVDAFLKENEEARGVINSGHTRQSAYVIRNVGDNHEPQQFSTWGAKVLCGIGSLAATLSDRAIILELRRKLPSETIRRLRHAESGLFDRLASQLARFAQDAGAAIEGALPALPEALNDRAQDNWEPLLAIADYAGGIWPELARATALKISGAEREPVSLSAELLADVQEVFDTKNVERISTADLLVALIEDDLKPWATYNRVKPISARQLAKRLKDYGISSKNLKLGYNDVKKGFYKSQFEDAFSRYLAPSPNTTEISATTLPIEPNQANTGFPAVAESKYGSATTTSYATVNMAEMLDSSVVAAKAGATGNDIIEVEL